MSAPTPPWPKIESKPELDLAVNGGAPRAFAEALLDTSAVWIVGLPRIGGQ
jgi:hypothetical protein